MFPAQHFQCFQEITKTPGNLIKANKRLIEIYINEDHP